MLGRTISLGAWHRRRNAACRGRRIQDEGGICSGSQSSVAFVAEKSRGQLHLFLVACSEGRDPTFLCPFITLQPCRDSQVGKAVALAGGPVR
jgi:hypothetical protein